MTILCRKILNLYDGSFNAKRLPNYGYMEAVLPTALSIYRFKVFFLELCLILNFQLFLVIIRYSKFLQPYFPNVSSHFALKSNPALFLGKNNYLQNSTIIHSSSYSLRLPCFRSPASIVFLCYS